MNHTTTADKGEQECREAFEKWAITQEWIAPVKNHEPFSRECYPDGDYDITAVRAAWAAWNRRPTNGGQDGLTDESVKTAFIEAHGGDEAYYNSHGYEIRWTTRIVTRHLSSKQAARPGNAPMYDPNDVAFPKGFMPVDGTKQEEV